METVYLVTEGLWSVYGECIYAESKEEAIRKYWKVRSQE